MTVFERTYRELERLEGVSLHDDVLLYKVTPEIPSFPDKAEAQFMQDVESMRERNKTNKTEWTWKALGWLLLGFGLAVWMFYEGLN